MLWLHIIQYSGFVLAQVSNATLVWLILTKAEKLFGTYRHVMCTFAVYSLVYAWVEVLTQPEIIFRPELLVKIEGFKLIYIFIPCLICFVLWFEFVYYGMANTVEKQIYMREELENYYEEDSTRVAFIAPMYWSIRSDGEKEWIIGDVIGSIGCVCIIVVCFSTIVICASTIYLTMKSSTCHMSARTLELNRQLFMTLTFQTLLPFLMMYSPVGLLITLPVFEVYVASLANIVPATLAIYPSLEPLIAMVCIKEFRRTITCKFKMRRTEM
ncbi:hypothetical protein B9Z55_016516 [Caenorhabditis nigoni]|uniref:Serpentine receptor class r-10 n=1 Tax=Caenorhabditis nigoni TaxID=1611254 RepID=A0A2G5T5J0_9PELO|nr:hypothetical protein B9Z55_016516 [Caenorhabditis nigoni]